MSLVLVAGALLVGCGNSSNSGSTGGTGGTSAGGSTTGGTAGSGGSGATTAAGGAGATGTTGGTGGTGGAGASTSSGGSTCASGAPSCTTLEDCPLPDNDCVELTCDAGCCGSKPKAAGAGCGDGDVMYCNASGACVECLSSSNCVPSSCSGGTFTAAGTCDAKGSCVAGADTDCLASGKVCDPVMGCVQCEMDGDCAKGKTCHADHTCQ